MKINLPVTNSEIHLDDDTLIVSKTDLKGIITYANADFMRISGYGEAELVGRNHNLVRHPDMPPAGFQDLWDTLKQGRPWSGLVKNRAKNGDFYWVDANVTPVWEGGQVAGYLSVRWKASRESIEAAAALYKAVNDGTAKGVALSEGRVVKTGWLARANVVARFLRGARLGRKLAAAGALLLLPLVIALSLLGADMKERIDVAALERRGVAYHQALRQVLQEVQKRRGLMALHLSGDTAAKERILAVESRLAEAAKAVDAADADHGAALETDKRWGDLRARWETLRGEAWGMAPKASNAAHTALTGDLIGLMDHVTATSGLALDPDTDSYYLMDAIATRLPVLTEAIGVARATGAAAISAGKVDGEAKTSLIQRLAEARMAAAGIERNFPFMGRANPALEERLRKPFTEASQAIGAFNTQLDQRVIRPASLDIKGADYVAAATATIDRGYALYDNGMAELDALLAARVARLQGRAAAVLAGALLLLALGAGFGWVVMRGVTRAMGRASASFAQIAQGNFRNAIEVESDDEIGDLMRALKSMQTKLGNDLNEANERAAAALRIKIGLDNVATNVMIADRDNNIIYLNQAVARMFGEAQEDIRQDLPNFDAGRLIGSSIDAFHKNPAHQREMLSRLKGTHRATIRLGGHTFALAVTPVVSERGERLGTAVEWLDRTAEVAIEHEVADLVSSAASGDFTKRLATEGKQGFFRELAGGLNQLVEVVQAGLNDIARVLNAIARGHLTERIEANYSGTFGQLKDDTNTTVERLRETVLRIKESSEAINTAAQEIAVGNQDLSSRTEEQASSLEETASSMEELNATVKQNAENAKQANQLAANSNEVAVKGGEMVKRVVDTMNDIQSSSKKIAEIVGVIDSIAFQTNILALNAAVEAARAGEQGRGFAVVASEVRNLAQRSATAAKEIKSLIAESVDKVDGGAKLVQEAGSTMDDVVTSFQLVANLVTEITNASREQSSGIEQVTQAVSQMDEVTQQNAALVEEAAAAAGTLEDQARTLVQAVSMFRVSDAEGQAPQEGPGRAGLVPVTRITAAKEKAAPRKTSAPLPKVRKAAGGGSAEHQDNWEEF